MTKCEWSLGRLICFVYTFWDCLASLLLVFAFMEVVLRNGFSRFEIKPSAFISECQTDSEKVNYFIELSAGWSACSVLQACRDTNVKLVILTEIRVCGLKRGCKIQILSLCTWKVLEGVVLMIRTTYRFGHAHITIIRTVPTNMAKQGLSGLMS